MFKITVEVEGMKCPMCEAHTNNAVKEALNVREVTSSHKENKTTILSDVDIPDTQIIDAIAETGYTVGHITHEELKKRSLLHFFQK